MFQSSETLAKQIFRAAEGPKLALVSYRFAVTAGFPSPADDHMEGKLNLNDLVARRPAATFYARASGESMIGAGIGDGDLLVVDRSLSPIEGDIVVAVIDGGLTVKRLERLGKDKGWRLAAANPAFQPLAIDPEDGVTIWGVVTYSLRRHCGREG